MTQIYPDTNHQGMPALSIIELVAPKVEEVTLFLQDDSNTTVSSNDQSTDGTNNDQTAELENKT